MLSNERNSKHSGYDCFGMKRDNSVRDKNGFNKVVLKYMCFYHSRFLFYIFILV